MKWATKPTKGLERGSPKTMQWEEEHKKVVFRLTEEGEEDGTETPCSGLHSAPKWAQKKRLSQTYKSPKVRDSKGEQTERKKKEKRKGLPVAHQSSELLKHKEGWNKEGMAL